jgi:hypothetical protein
MPTVKYPQLDPAKLDETNVSPSRD